jgi:hypothetical protein
MAFQQDELDVLKSVGFAAPEATYVSYISDTAPPRFPVSLMIDSSVT